MTEDHGDPRIRHYRQAIEALGAGRFDVEIAAGRMTRSPISGERSGASPGLPDPALAPDHAEQVTEKVNSG